MTIVSRAAVGLVACALVLTGCTDDGAAGSPSTAPSGTGSSDATTADVPAVPEGIVLRATQGENDLEYVVGPLVNDGDLAVLSITARDVTDAPKHFLLLQTFWSDTTTKPGAVGVRLLDADNGTVEEPVTVDGVQAISRGHLEITDEPFQLTMVFAASTADTVDVLVPFTGLAVGVPVIDKAELAALDGGDELESVVDEAMTAIPDPSAAVVHRSDLSTVMESIDGSSDTQISPDEVLVNVDADVLFAVDQSVISDAADASLVTAAAQFSGYPAGTLTIIGHTDDVADEAYNQTLSELRAQAVADRLGTIVDLSGYTVVVEGRGESEPRVPGTSADARAANRRVEIVFAPAAGATADAADPIDVQVPDNLGPTGTGKDGVVVTNPSDGAELKVTLPEVRRVGNFLVGEVEVSHVSGRVQVPGTWFAFATSRDAAGNYVSIQAATPVNLALLSGDQRVYPAVYVRDPNDPEVTAVPMTEILFSRRIDGPASYTLNVVWPDVSTGDSVTLDVSAAGGQYPEEYRPFRLTDVPVVE